MKRAHVVALAWLLAGAGASGQASGAPELTLASHLVPIGTTADFAVSGAGGALYFVHGSGAPAEIPLGPLGTLFLDPLSLLPLKSGALDATGAASFGLFVPSDPGLVDDVLYAQVATFSAGTIALGNAVVLRAEASAPSGARTPLAIAVTPDGTKLYVAHEEDGTLSVIDAVAASPLYDLPIGPSAEGIVHGPLDVAIEPGGLHVVVVNAAAEHLTVLHAPSDSIAALVPVPKGCRRAAFAETGSGLRLYVTNDRDEQVLVFGAAPGAVYQPLGALDLEGHMPSSIAVAPDGRLLVCQRSTHDLEVLDPVAGTTLTRIAIGGLPHDVRVDGNRALVAAMLPQASGTPQVKNAVVAIDLGSLAITGTHLVNAGTDYGRLAIAPPYLAVAGAGSGSLVIADLATLALVSAVNLVPGSGGAPANGTPSAVAAGGTGGLKAWTVDYFRETVRPVALGGGPPFALEPEIALAWSGAPRVPLVDLTPEENGDWFFRSVEFFNGTAALPNPTTCYTCHTDGGSHNSTVGTQVLNMWEDEQTGPYGSTGASPTLVGLIQAAFNKHTIFGGLPPPGAVDLVLAFVSNELEAPPSPHLASSGVLTPAQQAGKVLFEGAAQCSVCHAAPLFIPSAPPFTALAGVGTGFAPANVPTLLGIWATAPYFHDGSAATLLDVVEKDTGGLHGASAGLTAAEKSDLVAYLLTL